MSSSSVPRPLSCADTEAALVLYNQLTFGPAVEDRALFSAVLGHPGTAVYGAFDGTILASMVTLHLLPNVTWGGRPYGLVENVVTRQDLCGRGFGRQALQAALDAAWQAGAYKVMLLTGQKRGATGFYETLGFSCEDKHAMVIRQP